MAINGEYNQIVFRGTKADGIDVDSPEGFAFADTADPRTFPTLRHLTQLQEITRSILADRAVAKNVADYLQALYLTDAIYRSSSEGREVALAEFGRESDMARPVEPAPA